MPVESDLAIPVGPFNGLVRRVGCFRHPIPPLTHPGERMQCTRHRAKQTLHLTRRLLNPLPQSVVVHPLNPLAGDRRH